jgi:small redox-active disulfide protein 2
MVTKIEVLGAGCAKCKKWEKNVHEAIVKMDTNIEVVKVEDSEQLNRGGITMASGFNIDGEIVAMDRVPSMGRIKIIISGV